MGLKKFLNFINSPIGGKIVMALSGAAIILFLLGHALGNLLIFSSQTSLNSYANWLQHSPFLWLFRIAMVVLFTTHIFLAIKLSIQNRGARPIAYAVNQDIQIDYSAKTMLISGLLIFIFILFHLAHLTLGWISTTSLTLVDNNHMLDVYNNVVRGFQNPLINLFYIFSMLLIGLHLHHALKSIFQTLGFHHENFKQLLKVMSPIIIIALVIAFIAIPLAVVLGYLPEILPPFIKVVT
jgi:succinate dehydrogenase / fumarate reductase cytochrome b subunit